VSRKPAAGQIEASKVLWSHGGRSEAQYKLRQERVYPNRLPNHTQRIDIVYAPGMASHLDFDWEWPPKARFFEQLSSFSRLIRFDKRGTGLSDRPTIAATLEERIDDIRAVMDAANSEKAVLYGASEGGSMVALFAATYPARTRALVLWGTVARWTRTPDHPWGVSRKRNTCNKQTD
jgi:pimeloyl-ACP methyl ester carboxylesterase